MGGGNRHVVLNLNERVVSPDHNRHQQVNARERCEHLRFLANATPNSWESGGAFRGASSLLNVVTSPLVADVFEGLTVLPQAGTTSLFIAPGVVGLLDPDGQAGSSDPNPPNADDSSYKVVRDAGIAVAGVLTIGANAGPGVRIDVIECKRAEVVTENATRDIFVPATGSYVPTLVDKVSEGQLTYRVRAGVAGAGFPGTALGWLPLAVASVPAGSVSVDSITFWDVRPLVTDRVVQPSRVYHLFAPPFEHCNLCSDDVTAPAERRVGGLFEGEINGYKAGGRIRKGTPSAVMGAGDTDYVNALNTENHDPTFAPAGTGLWYLWLCTPFGLPRWVRYEETAIGQRLPWGPRGIPVVSSSGPTYNAMSPPAANIFLPASTGLDPAMATPVAGCICVLTGVCSGGVPYGLVADGDWHLTSRKPTPKAPGASGSLSYDEYTLVPGVDFPANARSVRVYVKAVITAAGAFAVDLYALKMHNSTGSVATEFWRQTGVLTPVGGSIDAGYTIDVPRQPVGYPSTITDNLVFRFYWTIGAGPTKATESCTVFGWRVDG